MRARVLLGVVALWSLVGVVSGTQAAIGSNLQGDPTPLGPAVRTALVNFLPWIPASLAIVWLAVRFPVSRATWSRNLWVHVAAIPPVTFGVNVLVVLGFWIVGGAFQGFGTLVRAAALWATARIHVGAVLYLAIAGVTHGIQYYRATRARELRVARLEGQLARARLQALNAQIRPHFLFNTLHTIGQLWRSGRSDDADRLLDHLGFLFQKVQSTASHPEVPLEEELEMVREYLAIERVRFRDRLETEVDATPEALECHVPPLLLQPLVENAIRHGISKSSSAGLVSVEARVTGERLRLVVRDDGPGLQAGTAPRSPGAPGRPGSGTGLGNTRERLQELYGARATMETATRPGGGFRVSIALPAVRTPDTVFDGRGPSRAPPRAGAVAP